MVVSFLCCVCVYALIAGFCWSLCVTAKDGIAYLKRLHQIPCSRCQFFTGDYNLKCAVHPHEALTEDAIGCRDFEPGCGSYASLDPERLRYPKANPF